MFGKTAGEALVDLLIDWGVEHIYGMPGDSINSIIEALRKKQDKIKFIQVRHEEAGALAACLCEINRKTWRLYGNCRTWCYSFIKWFI